MVSHFATDDCDCSKAVTNDDQGKGHSVISFSGGGHSYTFSKEVTKTSTQSYEFTVSVSRTNAVSLSSSLEVFGFETTVEGSYTKTMSMSTTMSTTTTTEATTVFELTLADKNIGDQFDVELLEGKLHPGITRR